MVSTTKLNIDKATVRQLFKAVVKASDEINEKSFVYGQAKRVLQIQPLAQASEFHVLNGYQVIMTALLWQPMVTLISEDGPIGNW